MRDLIEKFSVMRDWYPTFATLCIVFLCCFCWVCFFVANVVVVADAVVGVKLVDILVLVCVSLCIFFPFALFQLFLGNNGCLKPRIL